MKVEKLIEILKELPEDTYVYINTPKDEMYYLVTEAVYSDTGGEDELQEGIIISATPID